MSYLENLLITFAKTQPPSEPLPGLGAVPKTNGEILASLLRSSLSLFEGDPISWQVWSERDDEAKNFIVEKKQQENARLAHKPIYLGDGREVPLYEAIACGFYDAIESTVRADMQDGTSDTLVREILGVLRSRKTSVLHMRDAIDAVKEIVERNL